MLWGSPVPRQGGVKGREGKVSVAPQAEVVIRQVVVQR